jgi:Tn3 transposase DDE domain
VPGSRRHADPSSLLLPDEHWKESRAAFVQAVDRPVDGAQRLRTLADEQAELLGRLAEVRDAEAEARLEDSDLVLDPAPSAAGDGDEGRLRKLIEPRLPEVDLAELLIEVDGWTGFTNHLVPLSGNQSRSGELPRVLYAVIVAQATNLGLTGMVRGSEFSYQQLE